MYSTLYKVAIEGVLIPRLHRLLVLLELGDAFAHYSRRIVADEASRVAETSVHIVVHIGVNQQI